MSEFNMDMTPTENPNAECDLFIGATIGDIHDNTVYTDLTGKFPIQSFSGVTLVFVAYAYGPKLFWHAQ